MEEIEAKFLEIDIKKIIEKLDSLGAKKNFDITYRRRVFDFPNYSLESNHSWLRLRDEGDRITLAYKKRFGVGEKFKDMGMNETEIIVSDFNKTADILLSIGMIEKFYEENKRLKYTLDGVEFCIDEWPLIPPYLEIEGRNWAEIENMAIKLDLNWREHIRCSTMQIYKHYGIDEKEYSVLTFEEQTKK